MAALRSDPVAQQRAGQVLQELGLDSELAGSHVWQSRGRRLHSSMEAKATDVVAYPQFWPHVHFQLKNTGRSYNFQELDLRLLVTGELKIISAPNIAPVELSGRLELLKGMVYTEGNLGWGVCMQLYWGRLSWVFWDMGGWLFWCVCRLESSRRSVASKPFFPASVALSPLSVWQMWQGQQSWRHFSLWAKGHRVTHLCQMMDEIQPQVQSPAEWWACPSRSQWCFTPCPQAQHFPAYASQLATSGSTCTPSATCTLFCYSCSFPTGMCICAVGTTFVVAETAPHLMYSPVMPQFEGSEFAPPLWVVFL